MTKNLSATPLVTIDGHCHVASTRFIPAAFLEDVAANILTRASAYGESLSMTRVADLLTEQNQDHLADDLVRGMAEANISKTVLLAPDFSHVMRCELNLWEMACAHHEIRMRHPGRFYVFIGADPRNGGEGVDLFERCIKQFSFEGLKLYPPCGYSPSDRRLFPYYEICAWRRLPVLVHTGPSAQRLNYETALPRHIDEAARVFPTVNFILAHGGVNHVRECANLCAYRENLYLDIAGFTGAMNSGGWPKHVNGVFRCGINHKVIFGTDYPVFQMGGGLSSLISEFREDSVFRNISPGDQRRIMHGNILRLLSSTIDSTRMYEKAGPPSGQLATVPIHG